MSWCRAHFVDVWPDNASFSRVRVWNLFSCLSGAPSLTRGQSVSQSESLYGWQSVSQSVSTSWCRSHFVDVWPDIASSSRVWVWNMLSCLSGAPSLTSESESLYGWQSVSMSWCRAHFVDVWPDIASSSRVWVWNMLSCLWEAPSLSSESESLYGWQSVNQSVCLGVEPTLWTFDQILLPFQEFGSRICCPV
jgi:hypothetical protein